MTQFVAEDLIRSPFRGELSAAKRRRSTRIKSFVV